LAKGPSVIVDFTGLSLNGISLHIGVGIMGASSLAKSQWGPTFFKVAFEFVVEWSSFKKGTRFWKQLKSYFKPRSIVISVILLQVSVSSTDEIGEIDVLYG
jgi:hypothetical protein